MTHRLVLGLSIVGMLLSLHLWIQKERGFDRGCWGIDDAPASAAAGCNDPALEKAGRMFGVSTAAIGYLFYFAIASLTLAKLLLPHRLARHCHSATDVACAMALPITLYLIYVQAFQARAFCPLCLVVSAITITLFVVQMRQWRRGGYEEMEESVRQRELTIASAAGIPALGVFLGVMIFIDQVGTRHDNPADPANRPQFEKALQASLGRFVKPEALRAGVAASVQAPYVLSEWVAADTPVIGEDRGVTVSLFLDPNCPHCSGTFTDFVEVANEYKDRARFVLLARPLWEFSLPQIQAIELAGRYGKYWEMWRLQFERQTKGGLQPAQIYALCRELGLPAENLESKLAEYRPVVLARREKARAIGINSTPTMFINGELNTGGNRSKASLRAAIDQAIGGGAGRDKMR